MNNEIMSTTPTDDQEIADGIIDYSALQHAHIDPNLALPTHLQSMNFEEDIWRRMNQSKFKSPSLKVQTLRENPEKRDLLRSAISAASDREKEILMHNQARLFSTILQSVARSITGFLNEPLAPKSWKISKARSIDNPKAPGETEKPQNKKEDGIEQPFTNAVLLYLLTPKVFLSIIAIGFGVMAGYSQIQIQNLNETIATYEKTLDSLKANNEALDSRIADFDSLKDTFNARLNDSNAQLGDTEKFNIKLTTELAASKQMNDQLTLQISQLRTELQEATAGTALTSADLQSKIDTLNSTVATQAAEIASLGTKAEQWEAAYKSQEDARKSLASEVNQLRSEQLETRTDLARKESELSAARVQVGLLAFSERALKDIRALTDRYSTIADEHVRYHIDLYEARKARQMKN